MKSWDVLDDFSPVGCTNSFKFERVMIVQAHTHDGKNGRSFRFFTKKQKTVIYTKLLFFFGKIKTIFHFFHHGCMLEQS